MDKRDTLQKDRYGRAREDNSAVDQKSKEASTLHEPQLLGARSPIIAALLQGLTDK
jgi:hypothetical protein